MIKPEEYMSKPVITVAADQSVTDIVKLMDSHNIGSIVVVDDSKLAGIITERDILRRVVVKGKSADELSASDIMTREVQTADKDSTLMEVAARMKEHTMRRIVVVEDGRPVGIITSRDVINLMVE